jgi:hypothetical protein
LPPPEGGAAPPLPPLLPPDGGAVPPELPPLPPLGGLGEGVGVGVGAGAGVGVGVGAGAGVPPLEPGTEPLPPELPGTVLVPPEPLRLRRPDGVVVVGTSPGIVDGTVGSNVSGVLLGSDPPLDAIAITTIRKNSAMPPSAM